MKIIKDYKDFKISVLFVVVTIALGFSIWWAWRAVMTTPPYIDPERYPIAGIDVSRHNGMMNLDAAAADGIKFIFIKASEGATYRDSNFRINYDKAGHAGMKRGAYHFFRFDRDGISQAQNLLEAVGKRPLELGLVIDVEDYTNPDTDPAIVSDRLQEMVDYLILKGHRVMFYTNTRGYEKYLLDNFPGFPLWICSFSDRPVDADWTFWQYNHRGRVKGIRGDVDMNVFVGSEEDWNRYYSY